MSERIPIRRAVQFNQLDEGEVVEGYWSGWAGDPEPGNNHSFSFWHGWRNGRVDGGHNEKDDAMAALAADVVAHAEGADRND